ncbi:amino acid permease [Ectobacillus sp. sgz5001026]|uniref:amino acid permease n=1 Tax=Ectobacillus sp. sgz5001026 TaxID=3242473 RepID=UPI0036D3726E
MSSDQKSLQKNLLPRHVRLMALGGAIGTGIFKGTSETISLAGPAVIFSYIIAGLLLLVVMSAIAEMAIAIPGTNMKGFIRMAFGSKVSYVIGWMYAIMWLIVCIIEVIAAGSFLQYWFPSVPLWLLSVICAIGIISINTLNVKYYGEFEFWFAGLKIVMIILFIVLGAGILFGIIPSHEAHYFQNYTANQGFFPHGWSGVFAALIVVIFSYGGTELVGLSVTETKNAEQVLPKIIKGVIGRIVMFYTLPVLIICGLIPWNTISQQSSPFVQVLSVAGFNGGAQLMNFVLITAVLSAANSGIYGSSRMLYSLATEGEAPQVFSYVSKKGVPVYSLLFAAVVLIGGSLIAYLSPDRIFSYLMAIPGFTVSILWIAICLAEVKLRKSYEKLPHFLVWGFPIIPIVTAVLLGINCIFFMFSPENRVSVFVSIGIVVFLAIASMFQKKETK